LRLATRHSGRVHQVFILGAGLGTRLRPLTNHLPKPLVPLFHRPLAAWTVDACRRAGIRRFAINTHHLPEKWATFPASAGLNPQDCDFFHEPVLLDTGGGLKNIRPWIGDRPLLVHNGDIFSTLPLDKLIAAHESTGHPVTLALRSGGADKRIAFHAASGLVIDVRNELGIAKGTHVFSGIYCVNPEFPNLIPAGGAVSVIPAFLDLASRGKLGAVLVDEGEWLDLGDRESYLAAHRSLALADPVHPDAIVSAGATVIGSVIGPGAVIAPRAVVRNSVVWPGARVEADADLDGCIVCGAHPVRGRHRDADL
jgi:mannose-1-phosphate guanylyltransferase